MRAVLRIIDSISEASGNIARPIFLALVLVLTFEVIMRYAFDRPQLWAYEIPIILGAIGYALAWPYISRHNAHVRIDVVYDRLKPRAKAIIDVIGDLIFFFPLFFIITKSSFYYTSRAWRVHETFMESHWYPPIYPLRTVVTIGLCLLLLQGLAQFFRHAYVLIRSKHYD